MPSNTTFTETWTPSNTRTYFAIQNRINDRTTYKGLEHQYQNIGVKERIGYTYIVTESYPYKCKISDNPLIKTAN